jgi:oligopeptide/dipeptide ABC transporter ATP-binding protein
MTAPVLAVEGLDVSIGRRAQRLLVVDDVGFEVPAGGSLGIVGESGSGKSLTLRALMALMPAGARVDRGKVELLGQPLPMAGRGARSARRRRLAMVFQDPLSGLDPVRTVGSQVAEVPRRVLGASRSASHKRAIELLRLVGLPDPQQRAESFPHQLSGGMRQRVLIAMALASEPQVLLCDEPTTALDVTVQAQVLELLDDLRRRLHLAIVFVSHDLAVVRQVCDELVVMYASRMVEAGPTTALLDHPAHPYTLGLIGSVVDLDDPEGSARPIPGAPPDGARLPPGCLFEPRCRFASPDCATIKPALSLFTPDNRPSPAGQLTADELTGDGPATSGAPRRTRCAYPQRLARA